MKALITLMLLASANVFASDLPVMKCSEADLTLNSVYSMKTYGNETIKVFEIDNIEPAAASVGVAVAIDRGDDLANAESFCRYIPGFSYADVSGAKSSYNQATHVLTLDILTRVSDGNGNYQDKVLTLAISKGAAEADLVKASLN